MANYCKPVRQLLEKVQENCSHITGRRQKAAFGVAHATAVVSVCVCVCVWDRELVGLGMYVSHRSVSGLGPLCFCSRALI